MGNILDTVLNAATKYEPLVKTGIAALSTYASYEDQKKKNKLQQQAYNDYLAQVEEAGKEAQAAIDINYTPMVVSGVPQTKADVTDFTAVPAAKGGLMSIPNKQRKRYAIGTGEDDVMEIMDEEVITPYDLQMEEGVNIGEQVSTPSTTNPRVGAWSIWNSGGVDQEMYEFNFEIFFQSGDWMDMIRGESPMPMGGGETQMASNDQNTMLLEKLYEEYLDLGLSPEEAAIKAKEEFNNMGQVPVDQQGIMQAAHGGRIGFASGGDELNRMAMDMFGKELRLLSADEMGQLRYEWEMKKGMIEENYGDPYAQGGRIGYGSGSDLRAKLMEHYLDEGYSEKEAERIVNEKLSSYKDLGITGAFAQGGRIGYRFGTPETIMADQETILETPNEEVVINDMEEIQGQTAGGGKRGWQAQMLAEELAEEQYGKEFYDLTHKQQYEIYTIALDMVDEGGMKKGGRVKRNVGGIMDLGGMEKDYRFSGGFVPIGEYEKKDDVPARLSKNEFVFTADAVRAAGGGSINKGAQRMYDTMKNLEARPEAKRMTA